MKNKKQMGKVIEPFQEVSVNVILTYQDHPQQIYDMNVFLLKSDFRSSTVPNEWKIFGKYSPEKHVLGQIIRDIKPQKLRNELGKVSLCYDTDKISDYDEKEFSFTERTNSKYYFQPDQRDAFEDNIVETFGNSKKIKPYYKTFSHLDTPEHRDEIQKQRDETLDYFGGKEVRKGSLELINNERVQELVYKSSGS